jgi:hypothetical protein
VSLIEFRVLLIRRPRVVRAESSNKATAVHKHVHDHVNVHVDVDVLVDVIGFFLTARGRLGFAALSVRAEVGAEFR